jgi:subtilisin family serine protease
MRLIRKSSDGSSSTSRAAVSTVAIAVVALAATAPAALAAVGTDPADRLVLSAEPGEKVVVVLEQDAASTAQARIVKRAVAHGARVSHTYSSALNGFAATLPPDALAEIRDDPEVAYVETDGIVTIDSSQPNPPWGLDRIDQRDLPLDNSYTTEAVGAGEATGRGVIVYVIDTGIRPSHQEFGGRASLGYSPLVDCNGHGTHVAGTIGGLTYGVAKEVTLIGVRVLGCNGSGPLSDVIAGIDWVTSDHQGHEPAVANMSFGGSASLALEQAVDASIADGVVNVASAGNQDSDACNASPARVPKALTVGATTSSDRRWVGSMPQSGSNYGPCLDIFAPGEAIVSATSSGDTAVATLTGTSMAAPHVAGVAAQYLQAYPCASTATVANALIQMATPNKVINAGSGSPNRLLRTNVLMPCWVICTSVA